MERVGIAVVGWNPIKMNNANSNLCLSSPRCVWVKNDA